MSYLTKYSLETDPIAMRDEIARKLTELGYQHVNDGVTVFDHEEWNDGQGCKWYSHERDALQVSAEYPSVTITIRGIGEDDGDVWESVYLGGAKVRHV